MAAIPSFPCKTRLNVLHKSLEIIEFSLDSGYHSSVRPRH
jgi:hypothetical protein